MNRETLKTLGFTEKTYPDQTQVGDGIFMSKTVKASAMPDLRAMFYGDGLSEDEVAELEVIVEVTPDNTIQAVAPAVDYIIEAMPLESEEGMNLLRDALGGDVCDILNGG